MENVKELYLYQQGRRYLRKIFGSRFSFKVRVHVEFIWKIRVLVTLDVRQTTAAVKYISVL